VYAAIDRHAPFFYDYGMKVVSLNSLSRKESPIQYRRVFSGSAVFEIFGSQTPEKQVEFTIEHHAHGTPSIHVHLADEVDYPLLPVLSELKQHIREMDKRGHLP
jgi:hypothetical protein